MNNGLSRFTFYIDQIDVLMNKAGKDTDPAMWLYRNNARTPFFMLEGLSKIYAAMHNTKKFGKLKEHFKVLEDGLGQIDYYQALLKLLGARKKIPAEFMEALKRKSDQSRATLNEVLAERDWLAKDKRRIKKITLKLNKVDWLNPVDEVEAISGFYNMSISNIAEFVARTNYNFRNVENDVHELRRKLRWLSIYPQALQGVVQYARGTETAAHLKKYLTEEIISSPYNKLPPAGANTSFLRLHKNHFLALSWVIERLGNLKDEGLLLIGLREAIRQSTACNEEEALDKAYSLLGRKQRRIQLILDDAEAISGTFFKEKILQHLIAGTKPAQGNKH